LAPNSKPSQRAPAYCPDAPNTRLEPLSNRSTCSQESEAVQRGARGKPKPEQSTSMSCVPNSAPAYGVPTGHPVEAGLNSGVPKMLYADE
jgi:hypothetical protein